MQLFCSLSSENDHRRHRTQHLLCCESFAGPGAGNRPAFNTLQTEHLPNRQHTLEEQGLVMQSVGAAGTDVIGHWPIRGCAGVSRAGHQPIRGRADWSCDRPKPSSRALRHIFPLSVKKRSTKHTEPPSWQTLNTQAPTAKNNIWRGNKPNNKNTTSLPTPHKIPGTRSTHQRTTKTTGKTGGVVDTACPPFCMTHLR